MSKMQEFVTALGEIGRPAYAVEIAERVGVDPHVVSCRLNQCAVKEIRGIGRRLVAAPGYRNRKFAMYYLTCWNDELKKMNVLYPGGNRKEELYTSPRRPITDPREFGWHRHGIARHGLEHWAWITNRDPLDLQRKLEEGTTR